MNHAPHSPWQHIRITHTYTSTADLGSQNCCDRRDIAYPCCKLHYPTYGGEDAIISKLAVKIILAGKTVLYHVTLQNDETMESAADCDHGGIENEEFDTAILYYY